MNVQPASRADRPAIRDVARRSLQASYSLDPTAINTAIGEWYDEDALASALEDEHHRLLVAVVEDQVVGVSETEIGDDVATLLWLHVDPAYRGRGFGSTLFDRTRQLADERNAEYLQGRVLADNDDGTAFYEAKGFEKTAEGTVEIAGEPYREHHYVEPAAVGREVIEDDAGNRVFVDFEVSERGSSAGFHPVFSEEESERRYGYYCENCNTLANAMDAMGRIECDNCGNTRKPKRWDAAYM
jgi:ribosomal protein S18 acetylase RimI-like enzyme